MILVVSEKFSELTIPTVGSAYKEKVMHQILKIVGVSGKQLSALHEAVERCKVERELCTQLGFYEGNNTDLPRAVIIKSELDTKNWPGLYTVTITIPMVVDGTVLGQKKRDGISALPCALYISINLIRKIYDSLGVFPDEEEIVKSTD